MNHLLNKAHDNKVSDIGHHGPLVLFAELVYLGDARFGIKLWKNDLASCEENSISAKKFFLNLIEYLVSREDSNNLTGYGKGKVAMEINLRRAIRSM